MTFAVPTLAAMEAFAASMKAAHEQDGCASLDGEEVERLAIMLPDLLLIARTVADMDEYAYNDVGQCVYCGLLESSGQHTSDCAWVAARKLAGGGA